MGKRILFTSEVDEDCQLEGYINANQMLYISIVDLNTDHQFNMQHVVLDRSTTLELIDYLKVEVEKMDFKPCSDE